MKTHIKSVTVVIQQGTKSYSVGQDVDGREIAQINQADLLFQGDPYSHWIGLDGNGEMIFSINCLCPCEIVYSL